MGTSDALLSLFARKPAAAELTPEDELELRGQQSSLLQALSQQKSPYENTLEMSLAAALPALGTALAGGGSMGALGYGAVAGARGVESYGELMKAQQEKDRTASLLELSNIQNRLDAASMYRSEQAKNKASLERAKATTGLGQLLEAGGTPEDFLRLQEQKASLMEAQTQRALRPESLSESEKPAPEMVKKVLANQARALGDEETAKNLEDPNTVLTAGAANLMSNAMNRGETFKARSAEMEAAEAERAGFAGAKPLYTLEGADPKDASLRPTKKSSIAAIEAKQAYGQLNNSMAKFRSLLERSEGNLPNIVDKYSAEFLQLREEIVSQVRLLEKMGANFTEMEKNNVMLRMLGLHMSEEEEKKLWNLDFARKEALGTPDPLGTFSRFQDTMTNNYARSTLVNKFVDPTIRYSPDVVSEFGFPVMMRNTLLVQNNPELKARLDQQAIAEAQKRAALRKQQGQ